MLCASYVESTGRRRRPARFGRQGRCNEIEVKCPQQPAHDGDIAGGGQRPQGNFRPADKIKVTVSKAG